MVSSVSKPGQPVVGVAANEAVVSMPNGVKLGGLAVAPGRRAVARGSTRPKPLALVPDPVRAVGAPGPATFGAVAVFDASAGDAEPDVLRGAGGEDASFLILGGRMASVRVGFAGLTPEPRGLRQATQCAMSAALWVSHSGQVQTDAGAATGVGDVMAMVSALPVAVRGADADLEP